MNEWRPVSAVAFVLSRGFVPILAVACIAIEISFVVYALSLRESSFLTRWDSIGLAPLVVEEIFAILAALRREGITILLIEQNASAALEIADTAYVIETGRIALSGSAAEVARNPAVVAAYLGG